MSKLLPSTKFGTYMCHAQSWFFPVCKSPCPCILVEGDQTTSIRPARTWGVYEVAFGESGASENQEIDFDGK